jgi:hypothetical protein
VKEKRHVIATYEVKNAEDCQIVCRFMFLFMVEERISIQQIIPRQLCGIKKFIMMTNIRAPRFPFFNGTQIVAILTLDASNVLSFSMQLDEIKCNKGRAQVI